ncbi:barstar family protein [Mycobacterium angelicum]|uniref:Barstar (barnase inhibitor) domain-containing protein n=1 Tax=Mycobacterium angelicum TaxID=470074 RepID=A0A1W9ZY78_MYCAN|nr:barstar family protein [Mycobacterium angelicum]MCV7198474.1 barstar family protein [Mycobacterium angelicum]ORA22436.1 hypothetical protein BST12_09765 [Mycobacterium angelicum]
MTQNVNLEEFVSQAAHYGPCVGAYPQLSSPLVSPDGVEARMVDGARAKTRAALFDVFAEVWHFPSWFGRNMDAFDAFMRDLDTMVNTATGRPPARGYLTVVTDAHLLLIDQPEAFSWFATCMPFYRDYYRDEASPAAAFGLLLAAPADQLDAVRERWLTVGIDVATVTL